MIAADEIAKLARLVAVSLEWDLDLNQGEQNIVAERVAAAIKDALNWPDAPAAPHDEAA